MISAKLEMDSSQAALHLYGERRQTIRLFGHLRSRLGLVHFRSAREVRAYFDAPRNFSAPSSEDQYMTVAVIVSA
jgi:hypothetical protein